MEETILRDLEQANKEEWRCLYFAEVIFGVTLYPYQVEFLMNCIKYKRVAGLWSRQSGKSLTLALYVAFKALTQRNLSILIFAPSQRQSSELYLKIRNYIESNEYVRGHIKNITQTEMLFSTGSRIVSLPVGPTGSMVRSFTADVLIIEEASEMKDSIVNQVLLPMIAAKDEAQIIKIGTPKSKNHFYQSCYGANTEYKLIRITYRECLQYGHYSFKNVEEYRNTTTDLEFRTEYGAEFVEDSDQYFPWKLLQDSIDYDINIEMQFPKYRLHPKNEYVLGVDLARMGEDESVFIVVERDWQSPSLKVYWIGATLRKPLTDAIGRIKQLSNECNFRKIYIDETGLGGGVVDSLKEVSGRVEGVPFTLVSKMDLYSNLKLLLEKGILKIPNHKKLIYQLNDMRYKYTADDRRWKIHHSERGHDDYCDALALAAWHFKPARLYKPIITGI